jgi:hypothetical protein
MKLDTSGNIYKIELNFNKGYAFAELLDFSDVSDFDGRLIQVYNLIQKEKTHNEISIDDIIASGIKFGPVPINKYPNVRGKGAWILYGKNNKFPITAPLFKHYRGGLFGNWANLKPWFKDNRFNLNKPENNYIEYDYEEVRGLETLILNHPIMVKEKVTMMVIIDEGGKVGDYYDLKLLGNKNMYFQVVNTYYPKSQAEELIASLEN